MLEFETRVVHGCQNATKFVTPSIEYCGKEAQDDNKILNSLEKSIASLEHAKYGLCFPCGNACTSAIAQLLDVGDHAIVFDSVYYGTRINFSIREKQGKIELTFVDLRDPNDLEKYIKKNTRVVWIETPSNPRMKIVDIEALSNVLKNRKMDAFLVADNTFMTPYFQNPLLLGADIVMHSLTKYINGHSDCLMGAIATNNEELYSKLKEIRNKTGAIPSPLDCFLVNRGLKTLHIRMERHMQNALAIAQYLEQHPKVESVFYPGLASHPQHELAKKQSRGFTGMVSFCIKGTLTEARKFVRSLKIFHFAGSLGSTESLIGISCLSTARILGKEKLEEMGITENFIRISAGIEDAKDLLSDLDQAFEKVFSSCVNFDLLPKRV